MRREQAGVGHEGIGDSRKQSRADCGVRRWRERGIRVDGDRDTGVWRQEWIWSVRESAKRVRRRCKQRFEDGGRFSWRCKLDVVKRMRGGESGNAGEFRTGWKGWGGVGSARNGAITWRHDVRRRLLAIISPLDQKPFEGDLQGNINIAPSVEKAWFTSHSAWLLYGVLRGGAARRGGR